MIYLIEPIKVILTDSSEKQVKYKRSKQIWGLFYFCFSTQFAFTFSSPSRETLLLVWTNSLSYQRINAHITIIGLSANLLGHLMDLLRKSLNTEQLIKLKATLAELAQQSLSCTSTDLENNISNTNGAINRFSNFNCCSFVSCIEAHKMSGKRNDRLLFSPRGIFYTFRSCKSM